MGNGISHLKPHSRPLLVICSVAAFGAGCCLCVVFSHIGFTQPQSRCSKPSCQNKAGGNIFLDMPRFQHRFLVGKWFGGTCNVSKLMPTTSYNSTTRNVSMCFAYKPWMTPPLLRFQKTATIVENVSDLPAVKQTKKHVSATNAHQF